LQIDGRSALKLTSLIFFLICGKIEEMIIVLEKSATAKVKVKEDD